MAMRAQDEGSLLFEALLRQARVGDMDALGRLLESCRRYLLHAACRSLPPDVQSKRAPSDLVQESFLSATRDFAGFRGETRGQLLAWLAEILRHHFGHFLRAFRDCSKRSVRREVPPAEKSEEKGMAETVAAATPTPSDAVSRWENEQEVRQAVQALPADSQQVLLLRHWERRSFEEIGARLDCSAEAARSLHRRALRKLSRTMRAS